LNSLGVAGGKHHYQKGSGTNPLCLSRTPQFDYYGTLYGAEYDWIPGHHDHDVPCSVCLAPQSTTIMVPATHTCPLGWTSQYTGHLVAQWKNHYATEYVCLDGSPEDDSSGVGNDNGILFYYVMTVCGSLPCPPYINDKVVTCVVCSK
ncbi:short-chain collagen C4-like, partial [Littorina saxatilis]|uniref:short-chain collagen C4-like n=1 Tax=Littorina saxatilis TaxID=31220 RepID=UPI0038B6A375